MEARRTPNFTQITFHRPAELLNMNQRLHWSKRSALTKSWRLAARYAALDLGTPSARRHGPCRVSIEIPVPDNRRRDPANYFATVKPIVDGLVDAEVWPDDTREWVTVEEPVLVVSRNAPISVRLTPRN